MNIERVCEEAVYQKREHVTYGTVVHKVYHSETTKLDRGVNILLPANYNENKKYPVLYLLHGIFGDEYTLINDENCHIAEIVGNLHADGKAEEMIVVLPNMFATTDPNLKPDFTGKAIAPYDNFINDLVHDLIPYIEANYSVETDRKHRAIAGFSMGGRETLFIGFNRPDLFLYMAAISPAPGLIPAKDWKMSHPGMMSEENVRFKNNEYLPEVLMICCGTKDSVVGQFPASYHEVLTKNKVEHTWYEVPDADHDSPAIRSGLNNFLQVIYK